MFKNCFKCVEFLKTVSRLFEGVFRDFKGLSRVFINVSIVIRVSRVFQECFKGLSRVFQGSFKVF